MGVDPRCTHRPQGACHTATKPASHAPATTSSETVRLLQVQSQECGETNKVWPDKRLGPGPWNGKAPETQKNPCLYTYLGYFIFLSISFPRYKETQLFYISSQTSFHQLFSLPKKCRCTYRAISSSLTQLLTIITLWLFLYIHYVHFRSWHVTHPLRVTALPKNSPSRAQERTNGFCSLNKTFEGESAYSASQFSVPKAAVWSRAPRYLQRQKYHHRLEPKKTDLIIKKF